MKILRIATLAAVAVVALSGCGTLQAINTDSTATKGAVQFVVMNEIEQSSNRAAKAQRIIDDVKDVSVWLDTEAVTLPELHTKIMQRLVDRDLEPSRMLGATLIVEAVIKHLDGLVGDGVLSPEDKVTVNSIIGWVEQAARFYVRDTA